MQRQITVVKRIAVVLVVSACSPWVSATQPPTTEQLERYRADGSFAARAAAVRRSGNHLASPRLVRRALDRRAESRTGAATVPKLLPSTGRQRVFALLIGFSDYPGRNPVPEIDRRLFGVGPLDEHPYESLRAYYQRSSYGLLELEGSTLGWYTAPYPQSAVQQTDEGREALIREVIDHFDARGHDFSRYDSDGDGAIDYFLVFYAGPHQEWGDFWWGYQRSFEDADYTVDGLTLGAYSWQWEAWDVGGPFSARVAIHETGHALGLPDYYDYDDEVGPVGGVGGLDMMDDNWGDHNAFSKFLLGWVEPSVVNQGSQRLGLQPSSTSRDAAVLMHGDPVDGPLAEFFVVQHRRRTGNDADYPADGLLIWHVDARVDDEGRFLYDNSYTEHKLIRLMEADGLEEIEQGFGADAGDFYGPGAALSTVSTPSSDRYDGSPTNLVIDSIERAGGSMVFDADLGSGCGIFAELIDPVTGWVGVSTSFRAAVDFANCAGTASLDWSFGDGESASGTAANHRFSSEGSFSWELSSELGDAALRRHGAVLVCSDPRCYQWRPVEEMRGPRLQHSAVVLDDGRVLVVGGGPPAEIYDPQSGHWSETGPGSGRFLFGSAELLADGRVLVTGSSPGDPFNAEIYDPGTDSWTATGRMNVDRVMHSTVRLQDGRVMVAGGFFGDVPATEAEIWDPATGTWSGVGNTGFEEVPGLAVLDDGQVLVVGRKVTRIYRPSSDSWRRVSDLVHDHRFGATVKLRDGRVMMIGGEATAETEIFDPDLNLWRPNPPLHRIRAVPSAVTLPSGHVVVTGGADRFWRIGSTVEVFDPATAVWTEAQSMAGRRLAHTISVVPDGSVMVTGGTTSVLEEPYLGLATAERFLVPVQTTPVRNAAGRASP